MVVLMELVVYSGQYDLEQGLSFFRYVRCFNPNSVLENTEFSFIHFVTSTKVCLGIALY